MEQVVGEFNTAADRAYQEGRLACLPVVCRALLTVLPFAFGLATSVAGAVALTVTLLLPLLATGATLVVSLKAVEACMMWSAVLPPWDMLDPHASSYLDLQWSLTLIQEAHDCNLSAGT